MELWEEGLTLSIWASSVDLVLPWTLPPQAGKFDIIPTMTTIGSGIGIFGVATVLCDLLLLHILPKRHYYKQKKFKYAEDMGPGEGEHDPVATSSTLGLQENMRTS